MPSRSCGVTQVLQPNKNHFACVWKRLQVHTTERTHKSTPYKLERTDRQSLLYKIHFSKYHKNNKEEIDLAPLPYARMRMETQYGSGTCDISVEADNQSDINANPTCLHDLRRQPQNPQILASQLLVMSPSSTSRLYLVGPLYKVPMQVSAVPHLFNSFAVFPFQSLLHGYDNRNKTDNN